MTPVKKSLTLAIIGALTTPAFSQTNSNDAVVITATRTSQTYDEALASVSVIDRKEIDNSQVKTLDELLKGYAGIDIAQRGGMGSNSSIFMRGTRTGHVLFLIDGVKIGSATLGQTSFQSLPLDQIERIEIVRGPRSSLYGSEAIGGVIQIFTRKGGDKYHTHAEIGSGSDALRQASVSTSGAVGKTHYSFGASTLKTDGFNSQKGSETDDDGYKNRSFSLNLQHQFANGVDVQANVLRADGETEYDGSFQNNSDFVQEADSLKVSKAITENWVTSLLAGQSRDNDENYLNATSISEYTTRRNQLNWQNDVIINDSNTLTFGADQQTDDIGKKNNYTETERDNLGVYIQDQVKFGAHDIVASLRNDDNDSFGNHSTGSVAWGYKITDKSRAYTSYGTAFKAPSFNDLYYPWGGNPDLKPEESSTIEAGIKTQYSWGSMQTSIYRTDLENLIDWACTQNCFNADYLDDIWQPTNINEARIDGLEIDLSTELLGWHSQLALSIIDPTDTSNDNDLQLRAKQTAKLDFERNFGPTSVGFDILAQSSRYADAANTSELAGYGVTNVRAAWSFDKQWQLKGRINNVTDKDYVTAPNYYTQDRSYFIGVAYDTL